MIADNLFLISLVIPSFVLFILENESVKSYVGNIWNFC